MENYLLPFKIQHLVSLILEKRRCSLEEALHYLYSSELYQQLSSETPSLWYQSLSTISLYNMLKKEKLSKKHTQKTDSPLLLFHVFCLEKYRNNLSISSDEALHVFIKYDVFDYLQNVYETLHTQGEEYIIAEIKTYINNRKRKK